MTSTLNKQELSALRASFRYRQATWRDRRLPDALVIGAQRSGTTSLHAYLVQHPQLVAAVTKEVHFFDGGVGTRIDTFAHGEAWYRSFFPLKQEIEDGQKTFESTPSYLFHPYAPARIANLIPKVRLIALLRNPTQRAVSQYFHEKRNGHERLELQEALRAEEERLEHARCSQDYKNYSYLHHSYKSRGRYCEQLERYLPYFPRNQILLISSEQFFHHPSETLQRVFRFLDIDDARPIMNLTARNVTAKKSAIGSKVYEYLDEYFRPYNLKLYELTGVDFGW